MFRMLITTVKFQHIQRSSKWISVCLFRIRVMSTTSSVFVASQTDGFPCDFWYYSIEPVNVWRLTSENELWIGRLALEFGFSFSTAVLFLLFARNSITTQYKMFYDLSAIYDGGTLSAHTITHTPHMMQNSIVKMSAFIHCGLLRLALRHSGATGAAVHSNANWKSD